MWHEIFYLCISLPIDYLGTLMWSHLQITFSSWREKLKASFWDLLKRRNGETWVPCSVIMFTLACILIIITVKIIGSHLCDVLITTLNEASECWCLIHSKNYIVLTFSIFCNRCHPPLHSPTHLHVYSFALLSFSALVGKTKWPANQNMAFWKDQTTTV